MIETSVSASHFRVHLKDIANSVNAGKEAVTVERHGCQMFAVVSLEDMEFLRQHKYGAAKQPVEQRASPPDPPETIRLIHPELMPIELVEEAYGLTEGSTDEQTLDWRSKAWRTVFDTRGNRPARPP